MPKQIFKFAAILTLFILSVITVSQTGFLSIAGQTPPSPTKLETELLKVFNKKELGVLTDSDKLEFGCSKLNQDLIIINPLNSINIQDETRSTLIEYQKELNQNLGDIEATLWSTKEALVGVTATTLDSKTVSVYILKNIRERILNNKNNTSEALKQYINYLLEQEGNSVKNVYNKDLGKLLEKQTNALNFIEGTVNTRSQKLLNSTLKPNYEKTELDIALNLLIDTITPQINQLKGEVTNILGALDNGYMSESKVSIDNNVCKFTYNKLDQNEGILEVEVLMQDICRSKHSENGNIEGIEYKEGVCWVFN